MNVTRMDVIERNNKIVWHFYMKKYNEQQPQIMCNKNSKRIATVIKVLVDHGNEIKY